MRKRNGFTLIELLAVIAILAILLIIAIPGILDTASGAKKENFYLYAQNLNSKATDVYIQSVDRNPNNANCAVYDISKDLDLSNTGNYEGWVKVVREPVNSGKSTVSISFTSSNDIKDVKYCILKAEKCVPDSTEMVRGDERSFEVTKTLSEGEVLCAYYQYPVDNVLTKSETVCKKYDDPSATMQIDTYKYNVEVTLTDKNYVIQNFLISDKEQATKNNFYKVLDENKETPPSGDSENPLKIASPRCSTEDPIYYKGVYSSNTVNITSTTPSTRPTCNNDPNSIDNTFVIKFNTYGGTKIPEINHCTTCVGDTVLPTPTREGYTFDGWYYDSKFKEKVDGLYVRNVTYTEDYSSAGCLVGYKDINLYAKWVSIENTTTTTTAVTINTNPTSTRDTSIVSDPTVSTRPTNIITSTTTTRIVTTNYNTLLDSLVISGYPIDFEPLKNDYYISVPNEVTSLAISYVAHDPENSITFLQGNEVLGVGVNPVTISVFDKNTGAENKYRIFVKRFAAQEIYDPYPQNPTTPYDPNTGLPDPTLEESNASLQSLIVSGYVIGFNPDKYQYELEIGDEEELDVTYRTQSKYAIAVLTGDKNVKDGSIIQLNVQSQNGYYNKIYKITVHRKAKKSKSTKVLRITVISILVVLGIVLALVAYNNKFGIRLFRKKDK